MVLLAVSPPDAVVIETVDALADEVWKSLQLAIFPEESTLTTQESKLAIFD